MNQAPSGQPFIRGCFFALGATAIWSGNFVVARGLSDLVPPVSLAFFRWLIAVIVFAPFAAGDLIREKRELAAHPIYLSLTALLGISLFNTLIYLAGHFTTATNLSLIAITFPVFILGFARILYNEYLTIQKGIGIGMVLAGALVLITGGNPLKLVTTSFNQGDLWMLLASVIFAVYSLLLRNRPCRISIKSLQLATFILGLLFLVPFFIWEQAGMDTWGLNYTTVPAILYVGIFASLCAFVLWNKSIAIIGPSKAGMIYYTLPVFSGILAVVFLGESFGVIHYLSMGLILTGIFFTNRE